MPTEALSEFAEHFDAAMDAAYTWPLWGAAYVIGGGCSDDALADFRSSLISRGRVAYEQAISAPDSLAEIDLDETEWFHEGFAYVPTQALKKRLGIIKSRSTPSPTEPIGEEWSEEDLPALYPRLNSKYARLRLDSVEPDIESARRRVSVRVKRLLAAAFLLVILLCGSALLLGSKLIEPANHPVTLPAGFEARMVSIPGAGHTVAGWWVDEGQESPVVLLVHGIRADRLSMVTRAQLLTQHGFSVLLIDLQAHGETPGAAITLGYRESADVVAARDWIRQTAPGRRIGVIGVSLGGASVLLASQPVGFDAVVLEAVFPRVGLAVENRIRIRLGPLAPLLTPLLLLQLQPRLHVSESDLEPIRSIGRLAAPVLVVAGSRDEHTTLPESRELFAAAQEPKAFWVVQGAAHQDFLAYDRAGYETNVLQFLTRHLKSVALAGDRASQAVEAMP